MSTLRGWIVPAGLAAITFGALAWQHRAATDVQRRRAFEEATARTLAALRTENDQLNRAAVSADELALLRSDHAAIARLRSELAELRQAASRPPDSSPRATPAPGMPTADWRNVGRSTPAAVLETVLWAVGAGDVAALAGAVTFDSSARPAIDGFFGALPSSLRERYRTPERLVAEFTARESQINAARIVSLQEDGTEAAALLVRLRNAEGVTNPARLSIRRGEDGWKLVVPVMVIQRYANDIALTLSPAR